MHDLIEFYPDALTPDACAAIIQRFEASPHRQPGQVGSGVDRTLKDSRDLTISQHADWRESRGRSRAARAQGSGSGASMWRQWRCTRNRAV